MLANISEHRFKAGEVTLLVLPLVIAERYTPKAKALRISISDPEVEASLPEHPDVIGTLRLQFHDKTCPKDGKVLFSEKHARSVYQFIKQHEGYSEIMVHCGAGMSRSPAIAWALAESFDADRAESHYTTKYIPNQHVYTLMKKFAPLDL